MAAVYPDSYVVEAYIDATWTDITASVIGQIVCSWGIPRNGPLDLVAATGKLVFTLKNGDGIYSPNGAAPISPDWRKGAPIRLVMSYDGVSRTWYGQIDDFEFDASGPRTNGKVTVTVVDWMDKAAKYPINYPPMVVDQTADEVVQAIVDVIPSAPLATDFAVGVTTFPLAFDSVTDYTRAATEITKVAQSEICYVYVRHGGSLGETLVVENYSSRAAPTPVEISLGSGSAEKIILLETGDKLLLETGDALLNEDTSAGTEPFYSNDDALSYEVSFGDNVVNDVMFRYVTKEVLSSWGGANPAVWACEINPIPTTATPTGYNLQLTLDAGETRKMSVPYGLNNNGKGNASAANLFFQTAGQAAARKVYHYVAGGYTSSSSMYKESSKELWTAAITSDLTVSDVVMYLDRIEFNIYNANASRGYIDLYFGFGTGVLAIVYPETPVRTQDTVSIDEHDYQPIQFDMLYQDNATRGQAFADKVIAAEAQPRTVINRINYSANRSGYYMRAFLSLDIGDFFPVVASNVGVDTECFIQDMQFTIDPGGIIHYSLGVKEHYGNVVARGASYSNSTSNGTSCVVANVVTDSGDPNEMLFCYIAKRAYNDVTSVVRDGQNFTKYTEGQFAVNNYPEYEVWYLPNPNTGTHSVTVTLPSNDYFEVGVTRFYNVDQTSPFYDSDETQGTGVSASLTLNSRYGQGVFDILSIEKAATTVTATSPQVELMALSSDGSWAGYSSYKSGAGRVTMSQTISASGRNWIYAAFAIKAAV